MVKCKHCRNGRPKYWNKDGGFCDKDCYEAWFKKKWKVTITDIKKEAYKSGFGKVKKQLPLN